MIEIYNNNINNNNNNKELYTYYITYLFLLYCLSMQRCREPEDEHCVLQCTFTCNTLPLDNSKTCSHPALLYITWGLIWDSKIKKKESLGLKFSTRQASGILKLRQEGEIPIENLCKLLVSQGFEVENLASRKRSPIHRKRIRL